VADASGPVARQERISELDIIRGVALFGVLWINVLGHAEFAIPQEHLDALPTARIDGIVDILSRWIAQGKAQGLFSLLFGFGFAMLMDRLEGRGADATAIYLRRLTILLVIGIAHLFLLWNGDILHVYALMGFLLLLTRRWPGWLLLLVGLALATFCIPALVVWETIGFPGGEAPWIAEQTAGQARRFALLQGSDYGAFVAENVRVVWYEVYGYPIVPLLLGFVLGRFMVGAWIYRQGWLQEPKARAAFFRRWATILIPAGLLLSGLRMLLMTGVDFGVAGNLLVRFVGWAAMLPLALGYAALVAALCQKEAWRRRLSGFGATGQMALTNYVTQSFFFVFVLYGFGLGLLPWNGATFALGFTIAVFVCQVAFSRWWLARYRFGPLEWVWRSLTYGTRQPMRLASGREAAPAG
jgi:uncharacterized protein